MDAVQQIYVLTQCFCYELHQEVSSSNVDVDRQNRSFSRVITYFSKDRSLLFNTLLPLSFPFEALFFNREDWDVTRVNLYSDCSDSNCF